MEKHIGSITPAASKLFGVEISPEQARLLAGHADELLKWNRRINLTSITDPREVAELHVLDSLAPATWMPAGASFLDVGTGGGFPGLPLAIVRSDIRGVLVDRTEKKVLFLKTVIAQLGLPNAKAQHVRLEGSPEGEGLEPFDVAVSRAFTAPDAWLPLARLYVRPGGRIIAMLGSEVPSDAELARMIGTDRLVEKRSYRLPSGAARTLLVVERS